MKKNLLLLLSLLSLSSYAQFAIEGFESTWPPADWNVYNVSGPLETWQQSELGSPVQTPFEGNYAAYLNDEDVADGTTTQDFLVSPSFTVPVNPQIRFMSRLLTGGNQGTVYKVMMLPGGGDPTLVSNYILLEEFTELEINPSQQQYNEVVISNSILIAYAGQNIRIAFVMEGDNGDGWLIDNVQITSECEAPTNLTAVNISLTTATLSWTGTGIETMWQIEVLPVGATPTGNGVSTSFNPYIVTGLIPGSCYVYYVRSVCSPNNTSVWSGPFTFCTVGCQPTEQCSYSFNLTDTGNDGWGDNAISIIQNGAIIAQLTLTTGGSETYTVSLCDGTPFEIYWNGTTATDEIGFSIVNNLSQTIYTKPAGTGTPNTTIYSGLVDCGGDDCMISPSNLAATVYNTQATLSWGGFPQGSYEYYVVTQGSPAPISTTDGVTVTGNSVALTNFSPNTTYSFYVRAICPNQTSVWAGPFDFTIGTGNTITGTIMADVNNDGVCNDQDVAIPGVEIEVSIDGMDAASVYTNENGEYIIFNLANGISTISLQPLAPAGYAAIPAVTESIDFGTGGANENISFCIPEASVPNDIDIVIIPGGIAQPGFNAQYLVIVSNNSPVAVSNATVTIQFDNAHVQFVSVDNPSVTTSNSVTFDTGVINPYGTNMSQMIFYVYPPQVNVGGETLVYTGTVSMTATDDVPANNTYVLSQITVNSYDPNDITVHEGPFIYEEQADDYLTYTIRFQNTGTANAVNIRLDNTLDPQLDWDTFVPITSSHNYYVTRNGGQLQFHYPNIQLPDSTANEPGSHGFVTYRIKPKSTFGLGDIISNQAEIYFDFNPAIITNIATTEVIEETMGTGDFSSANVKLYPNPVQDKLNVSVVDGEIVSVNLFDMNGREFKAQYTADAIDTSGLSSGMYLIRITTDKGSSTHRILKK
jgi:uncharacterized repeat protein (TIGR01451 family)